MCALWKIGRLLEALEKGKSRLPQGEIKVFRLTKGTAGSFMMQFNPKKRLLKKRGRNWPYVVPKFQNGKRHPSILALLMF